MPISQLRLDVLLTCRSSNAQQRRPAGDSQAAAKRPKLEPPAANGHAPGPQQQQPQQPQQQSPKQEPPQPQPIGQVGNKEFFNY